MHTTNLTIAWLLVAGCVGPLPGRSLLEGHPARAERVAAFSAPANPFALTPTIATPQVDAMGAMLHGMNAHQEHSDPPAQGAPVYVCPMHPEIVSSEPGVCSECGMKLKLQPAHQHEHEDGQ
jgi:hypothetical protein